MSATSPGPVIPERYVAALGDADPLKSMKKAPKRLERLLGKLSAKKLTRRVEPGKWSIHEVVGHLADGEVVIGARLRMVAAENGKQMIGYDQDAFAERLGLEGVSTRELLRDFAAVRRANVGLLERLPREAFGHVGMHDERGPESVEHMLRMYAGHDLIHEAQIERLIAGLAGEKRAAKAAKRAGGAKAAGTIEPARGNGGAPAAKAAKAAEKAEAKKHGKKGEKKGGGKKRREPVAEERELPLVEGARLPAGR